MRNFHMHANLCLLFFFLFHSRLNRINCNSFHGYNWQETEYFYISCDTGKKKSISPLNMFRLSDPSQNTPPHVDWDQQAASPVFGASSNMKNNLCFNTSHSPSILDTGLKSNFKNNPFNNPSNSRSHKVRSKSEDIALVAPLNLGTEVNSIINQASTNRQMIVKKNTGEPITCVFNTCAGRDEVIKNDFCLAPPKQLGRGCAKRKKAEDEHLTSCERTSFNKENSLPFQVDSQVINGEHTVDKPLDLSDRFSGAHCQGSDETCKNRLKQMSLHDVFPQLVKTTAEDSSFTKSINSGTYFLSRDAKEDPHVQEATLGETCTERNSRLQTKEEIPSFKVAPLSNVVDTQLLFDDVKVCFSKKYILFCVVFFSKHYV